MNPIPKRMKIKDQLDGDIMDHICGELYLEITYLVDKTQYPNYEEMVSREFDDVIDKIDTHMINLIEGVINE